MRTKLRRNALWFGFLAVLVPLTVLLFMQYRWLSDLNDQSIIAYEATVNNYLEAVSRDVEYYYRETAAYYLDLPADLFTEERLAKATHYLGKKSIKQARQFFIVSFVKTDTGKVLFYDPARRSMEPPTNLAEARAVYVAAAPWQALSKQGAEMESVGPAVDERDPNNRILLNPIIDEESRIVGIVGMIVDHEFFHKVILPKFIQKAMPEFFGKRSREYLVIRVHDGKEESFPPKEELEGLEEEATHQFSFIFADHHLGLSGRGINLREWAHKSFVLNMSTSIVVALVLLGGIILALRMVSREMKLSQMKNDFVSNVSHELRTPLASIRVFGEFLALGRVNSHDKVREYGEYIETESRRLTRLVNNILDFAKIESGAKTYRFESADISEIVEKTLKTYRVRVKHSGVEIGLRSPGVLHCDRVDPDAISQAVSNLLDNAVKYSQDADRIDVSLDQQNGWVQIAVKDHGIGISKEEQKKIFDRFHRVGTGLVHDVKGSGLGLSIVNHIVQAHRGRVMVESEVGKGSTFTIRLPLEAEESNA